MSEIRMKPLSEMAASAGAPAPAPAEALTTPVIPAQPPLNLRPIELSTEAAPDLFSLPAEEPLPVSAPAEEPDPAALEELAQALEPQEGDMTLNGTVLSDQSQNVTTISKGVFACENNGPAKAEPGDEDLIIFGTPMPSEPEAEEPPAPDDDMLSRLMLSLNQNAPFVDDEGNIHFPAPEEPRQ